MLVSNRIGAGLTRSVLNSLTLYLFPVKGARKHRPRDGEPLGG